MTADAECIKASATENPDLFRVIPMSYGTFGFLTRINIRVVSYILIIMTSARVSKRICNRVGGKKNVGALLKKKGSRFTYCPGFVCTTNHPSRLTRPLTSLKRTRGKRFHMNFHSNSNMINGLMTIIKKKEWRG